MLENFITFENQIEQILFWIFVVFFIIQLLYSITFFLLLALHKDKKSNQNKDGVSIIIAARNESDNLFEFLPKILQQNYPNFEVIVINDQSHDDSKYILKAFQQEYNNLHIVEIEKSKHLKYGKKLPITLGIKAAKYEKLLLTDADCIPASNDWLRIMSSQLIDKHELVLGYGPYFKKKGWVNFLIRLDTLWIAIHYFSFAKMGIPYMGVGRNIAYTKQLFNRTGGFKSHYDVSSGDDDLFVQEAAKNKNYTICLNQDGYTFSEPCNTWKEWKNQKSRHFSTTPNYNFFKKLLLGIYPFSLIMLLFSFVTLLFNTSHWEIVISAFSSLLVLKWVLLGVIFHKLNNKEWIPWIPLLDIFYVFLAPAMYYTTSKKSITKW